jgi:hypothetical protein
MADPPGSSAMIARLRWLGRWRVASAAVAAAVFGWLAWRAPAAWPAGGDVLRGLFGVAAGLQLLVAIAMLWQLRRR